MPLPNLACFDARLSVGLISLPWGLHLVFSKHRSGRHRRHRQYHWIRRVRKIPMTCQHLKTRTPNWFQRSCCFRCNTKATTSKRNVNDYKKSWMWSLLREGASKMWCLPSMVSHYVHVLLFYPIAHMVLVKKCNVDASNQTSGGDSGSLPGAVPRETGRGETE